jgi:fucose permease
VRYASLRVAGAAYCSIALWAAIATGRAGTPLALRFLSERAIRLCGIALATAAIIALRFAHTALEVASCAAVAGLGIAPFVPITFSLLINARPTARQAGAATANIGLGAALFSLLTGALSTYAGSLHFALLMPIGLGVTLVVCCIQGSKNMSQVP